ncbi:MAG: YncE family protein [Planctomycetes bacterium]|nr:YncE family protein [Planctomycetota bacterium]
MFMLHALVLFSAFQAPLLPVARDAAEPEGAQELHRELLSGTRPLPAALANPPAALTTFSSTISCNGDPDADGPHELAFTPDGTTVVIAHKDTDNLTFFDVNARTVTHTVAIGDFPVQVAVTPNGQYALAPCVFSNAVSVVDVATHALVATVPVSGQQPFRVMVTSDSQWAVVSVINDGVNSQFSVISLATLAETAVIPSTGQGVIGFYGTPESGASGILFSKCVLAADDRTLVLPDRANARVTLYDRLGVLPPATISTAAAPEGVDASLDGTVAVVSHEGGAHRISKIDLVSRTLAASFTTLSDLSDQTVRITPNKGHAIAAIANNVIFVDLTTGAQAAQLSTGIVGDIVFTFDGAYAFVSNFNSSVIDLATRTIVRTLTLAACAEAAASPVARRVVALNNRFREDAQVYNVNGAAGFVEGLATTGAPPEGDASRSIAVSGDGRIAVVGNNTSRNVSVVDLVAGSTRSWVTTGERPLGVAITPDGTHAVVCNGDSDTVSIIDLATDTRVANLSVPQRPAEVRISPDSQTAYVTTIAGTDRIYFLHLAGAASSVISSFPAGQMGSANGYAYIAMSSMELSPDGSTLAICISFDDQLLLVDTATRTEIARVLVGDFPYRVAWKPDGTRAYVINSFGDSVSVVNVAGAVSSTIATVAGIDFPSTVDVDAAGAYVYVADSSFTAPAVRVIDTATNAVVATLPVTGRSVRSSFLSNLEGVLYLAAGTNTGGELLRVSAAGPASAVLGATPLSASPGEMGFSEALRSAVVAQPIPDAVDVRRFDLTTTYCIAAPNSVSPGAFIGYTGSTSVGVNDFRLRVTGATSAPGLFYYGDQSTQIPLGDGWLCVTGNAFRLGPATNAPGGVNSRLLNFAAPPAGSGLGQVLPGSTWYFQYRYRNVNGPLGTGYNQSDALQVTFTP